MRVGAHVVGAESPALGRVGHEPEGSGGECQSAIGTLTAPPHPLGTGQAGAGSAVALGATAGAGRSSPCAVTKTALTMAARARRPPPRAKATANPCTVPAATAPRPWATMKLAVADAATVFNRAVPSEPPTCW